MRRKRCSPFIMDNKKMCIRDRYWVWIWQARARWVASAAILPAPFSRRCSPWDIVFQRQISCFLPVSYTHLDVYKRQIPRATHAGSYIHVGPAIGVASTKAFTGQVTVLTMLALTLAKEKKTMDEGQYLACLLYTSFSTSVCCVSLKPRSGEMPA